MTQQTNLEGQVWPAPKDCQFSLHVKQINAVRREKFIGRILQAMIVGLVPTKHCLVKERDMSEESDEA